MIGQDYHLLGSKPWRIRSSDERVGARTTPLGYAARLKRKIQCVRADRLREAPASPTTRCPWSRAFWTLSFIGWISALDLLFQLFSSQFFSFPQVTLGVVSVFQVFSISAFHATVDC